MEDARQCVNLFGQFIKITAPTVLYRATSGDSEKNHRLPKLRKLIILFQFPKDRAFPLQNISAIRRRADRSQSLSGA